ncbi:MAG: PQQ-binding-like beta-propeller repeat protein [Acidobacteria bacterium]|nr:PQQ-binding-like beta-propeller repeat protein [Acidobacteriota bacterium]
MKMGLIALWMVSLSFAADVAGVRMIEVEGEGRKYWPRWRGPSGQGVVEGKGYPDTWSATQNVLWNVEAPGRGNSSPIVWGDRIFLTAAADDGARRVILCFRRGDGKLLWEAAAPDAPAEKIYRKNTFASSTPVTDGERVYAYFGNAGLLAVDLNGKRVWHRSLGTITLYHGSAGSPLLYKDRLILYQDQRQDSFIAAFDKRTGEVIWRTRRQEQVGWGSPVAVRVANRDEIIVNSQHRVTSYDPATGKLLWSCSGTTFEVTPTPAVGHGLVYCPSGRAGPTLAIRPGGEGDVTGTHVAWQTPRGSPFIPSPLVYGDYLYLVNDMTSVATCFEAATGKLMWQGRLGEAQRESFSASPIAVDGKVFITNDQGETFVLAAGPEFRLLRVNAIGERTLATPALVDGKWYFRTQRRLVAIGR